MSRSYLKSKISSNNNIKDIKKYDFHNLNFDLNNKKTILKVIEYQKITYYIKEQILILIEKKKVINP